MKAMFRMTGFGDTPTLKRAVPLMIDPPLWRVFYWADGFRKD